MKYTDENSIQLKKCYTFENSEFILSHNYSPASFAVMRINTRKINNQARWCVGHVKSSNYFSAQSNTHKKSVYSVTHYCYRWLQDIWKKAAKRIPNNTIKLDILGIKITELHHNTQFHLANVKLSAISPRVPLLCF